MADQPSEEKTLAASKKALRDARKKGQVSRSRDLVTGFSLLGSSIYLLLHWQTIRERLVQLVDDVTAAEHLPFETAWLHASAQTVETLYSVLFPLFVIVFCALIVLGTAGTLGPVLAVEAARPGFNRMNYALGERVRPALFRPIADLLVKERLV